MDAIVKRFFTFEKMISTILIKIIYWAGLLGVVFTTLGLMFSGFGKSFGSGILSVIWAPVAGVFMLILWRFLCELYLVAFGIYDRLGKIQEAVGGGPAKGIETGDGIGSAK